MILKGEVKYKKFILVNIFDMKRALKILKQISYMHLINFTFIFRLKKTGVELNATLVTYGPRIQRQKSWSRV